MSQDELKKLFSDAFRRLAPNRPTPDVEVSFYPYAGLNHTIRVRSGRVRARLSDIFKDAPADVHRALAFILVSKLLSKRTPAAHERLYRTYACSPEIQRAIDATRRERGRKVVSSARGRVYDLEQIFTRLNRRFFDGALKKPTLTWSQRETQRILGHHDAAHDTIVISKSLDEVDVPDWFVEFVLYHEMLHIKHPARVVKGRRYYHTRAFRVEERRFPYYEEAQGLLEHIARQRQASRARAA